MLLMRLPGGGRSKLAREPVSRRAVISRARRNCLTPPAEASNLYSRAPGMNRLVVALDCSELLLGLLTQDQGESASGSPGERGT
jgi:hypothetical protein